MATAPTLAAWKRDEDRASEELAIKHMTYGVKGKDGVWIPPPLWWLWYQTQTFDNHWLEKGLKGPYRAFPRLPYMKWLFARLLTEPITFWPKSREMMLSWAVIGYCVWFAQMFPSTLVLVQSQKLGKSAELVKGKEPPGYAYSLWANQDSWLRDRHPLAVRAEDLPADKIAWKNGSAIQAIPAGADQVRLFHPTVYVQDESAFLEEAGAAFGAASPVAKQMIIVSSAGPSWFGDICGDE